MNELSLLCGSASLRVEIDMASSVLFFLFAGFAIVCAVSMVYHKNPLYSAVSLVGVFIALSCIHPLQLS